MQPREVGARDEDVGVARERLCREQAAVRLPVDTNARRIDVRPRLQILCAGNDVLVFGVATRHGAGRIGERSAVPDAHAKVDGDHDIALIG